MPRRSSPAPRTARSSFTLPETINPGATCSGVGVKWEWTFVARRANDDICDAAGLVGIRHGLWWRRARTGVCGGCCGVLQPPTGMPRLIGARMRGCSCARTHTYTRTYKHTCTGACRPLVRWCTSVRRDRKEGRDERDRSNRKCSFQKRRDESARMREGGREIAAKVNRATPYTTSLARAQKKKK